MPPRDEEEIYLDHILDHHEDPYHRGHCPDVTHAHEDKNPLCGDVVKVELQIDESGVIRDAWFNGKGCIISQASASMLMEQLAGKTLDEVKKFTAPQMLELYGARLTPNRQKCCLLSWRVVQTAVHSPVSGSSDAKGDLSATAPVPLTVNSAVAREERKDPANLPLDPTAFRGDFPILSLKVHGDRPLIYFDNAASTQRPQQVLDAMAAVYERHYANVHRGVHVLSEECTDLYEKARETVRSFVNARQPHEIIFTSGTTAGINLVARSWGDANMKPGDEILLNEMEHHSNIVPWHQLAQRTGCTVRFAPLTDDGQLDRQRFSLLLSPRTKLVALSGISNVLGTINPVEAIVEEAHAAGALVLVDAAQSAPHTKLDVQSSGADFVSFSGHKMLGPSGIGALYGRERLLDAMPPFLGGGGMIRRVTTSGFESGDLPEKFEAGTPPIVPAIGLAAAIDYLDQVGLERIHAYEQILTRRAHEVLLDVGGLRILGPDPSLKGGIVSFVVDGIHAHDVAQKLDYRGIAIRAGHHCTMPLHDRLHIDASNRASFYFYNTLDEVEQLGPALREANRSLLRK